MSAVWPATWGGFSGTLDYATQAEAEAGTANDVVMSPVRAKQTVFANLPVINAVDDPTYGADATGAVDATVALQAAVDAAALNGKNGRDVLIRGDLVITDTIVVNTSGVRIVGNHCDTVHDTGGQKQGKANLIWKGAAGGTMVRFTAESGASNPAPTGGGMIGVGLYANDLAGGNRAAVGLEILSWKSGTFDVYGHEFTEAIVKTGAVAALGEARDPQTNQISVRGEQTTEAGSFLILEGDAIANTSHNLFPIISGNYGGGGTAIVLKNADSNIFNYVRLFRAPAGTGIGVEFQGSDDAEIRRARANLIHFLEPGLGGVTARGTTSYTYPSEYNLISCLSKENGAPDPTIETGASLYLGFDTDGRAAHVALQQVSIGSTGSLAVSARDSIGTESARIINGSSNHLVLENGARTLTAFVNMDNSTGNIRLIPASGQTVVITTLPTSADGLTAGCLWNDAGTVKVVTA